MTKAKQTPAERAAIDLAYRTLEYVSLAGEKLEEMMDCDIEMWNLARAVLTTLGQSIPSRQNTSKAWVEAIHQAKANGQAA